MNVGHQWSQFVQRPTYNQANTSSTLLRRSSCSNWLTEDGRLGCDRYPGSIQRTRHLQSTLEKGVSPFAYRKGGDGFSRRVCRFCTWSTGGKSVRSRAYRQVNRMSTSQLCTGASRFGVALEEKLHTPGCLHPLLSRSQSLECISNRTLRPALQLGSQRRRSLGL